MEGSIIKKAKRGVWQKEGVHPEYKKYSFEILLRHMLLHDSFHYIEASDRAFDLCATAAAAGMPVFLFSRMFLAVVGESASAYAAGRCRPTAGNGPTLLGREELQALAARLAEGVRAPEPRIVEKEESRFVGLACNCAESADRVPRIDRSFRRRKSEIVAAVDDATYCIYRYELSTAHEGEEEYFPFSYLAALELGPAPTCHASPVPKGMELWRLPASRYAVFEYPDERGEKETAYRRIYGAWFPRSGESLGLAPFLERRPPGPPRGTSAQSAQLWIPLAYGD
jgi:predicted transcriptional regulator YdeE